MAGDLDLSLPERTQTAKPRLGPGVYALLIVLLAVALVNVAVSLRPRGESTPAMRDSGLGPEPLKQLALRLE